jgi:hypothetical protein
MSNPQERREGERVSCKLVVPFRLTKTDGKMLMMLEGQGHAINRSARGMLLLLPEEVNTGHVLEIHLPSQTHTEQSTKLLEVCWVRPVPVNTQANMYLAGTRLLFVLPSAF